MKKTIKRTLPLLLAAVMLLSTATLGGLADFLSVDAHATEYQVGDIVEFGSYPQTEVKDEATLNALNSKSLNWISYGYYSGNGEKGSMVQSDYMKYADVTYNGTKYRAVKFTEYRPDWTYDASSDSNSFQDDNGYTTNTTYWFKYEPLKWRVLDPNEGFIMCETIIDSQAYSNTVYYNNRESWNDSSYTNYANDYETSSIREWLNDDFYNTAFTSNQKSKIKTTTLDNSAYSSEYDSASTKDKVFLLSYDEVKNTQYGFNSTTDSSTTREAKGSDYAKCQGIASNENSNWRLRSPGNLSNGASSVYYDGYVGDGDSVNYSYIGVRPALKISNLSSLAPASANNGTVGGVVGSSGNVSAAVSNFMSSGNIIYTAVGIVLGMVIMFIIVRKKNPSGENKTGKKSKLKTTAVDANGEQNCNIDFSEIVSFATLTDEQLEHLNQKLNEQNTKTKFKNFKLK